MRTLLDHSGSRIFNRATLTGNPDQSFSVISEPTPAQLLACELLALDPERMLTVDVRALGSWLIAQPALSSLGGNEVPFRFCCTRFWLNGSSVLTKVIPGRTIWR